MWMQPFNVMDESEVRGFVEAIGALDLVTVGQDGFPLATRLPLVWRDDRLILHMAIANPHWRSIADGSPALGLVTGPEAYITPSWYAGKRDGGLVVPTWNYSAVQFRGRVTVHRDSQWLLDAVTVLSDEQESPRVEPWAVSDATESFIAQQLKAIVGRSEDRREGKECVSTCKNRRG